MSQLFLEPLKESWAIHLVRYAVGSGADLVQNAMLALKAKSGRQRKKLLLTLRLDHCLSSIRYV